MKYSERRQRELNRQLVQAYALESLTNEFYGRHELAEEYRSLAKAINSDILAGYPQPKQGKPKTDRFAKRLNDIYEFEAFYDVFEPEFKAQKPLKPFVPQKVTIYPF